ncbi:hypothetical protein ACP70R_045778 [Stipagrostis hirtigluma subsp. patula]
MMHFEMNVGDKPAKVYGGFASCASRRPCSAPGPPPSAHFDGVG